MMRGLFKSRQQLSARDEQQKNRLDTNYNRANGLPTQRLAHLAVCRTRRGVVPSDHSLASKGGWRLGLPLRMSHQCSLTRSCQVRSLKYALRAWLLVMTNIVGTTLFICGSSANVVNNFLVPGDESVRRERRPDGWPAGQMSSR